MKAEECQPGMRLRVRDSYNRLEDYLIGREVEVVRVLPLNPVSVEVRIEGSSELAGVWPGELRPLYEVAMSVLPSTDEGREAFRVIAAKNGDGVSLNRSQT